MVRVSRWVTGGGATFCDHPHPMDGAEVSEVVMQMYRKELFLVPESAPLLCQRHVLAPTCCGQPLLPILRSWAFVLLPDQNPTGMPACNVTRDCYG